MLAVLVVPKLRCDPDVFPFEPILKEFLKGQADLTLVAVDRSTVKVAITDGCREFDGVGDRLVRDMVGSKCPQADRRHVCPRRKNSLRNSGRTDYLIR